MRTIKYRQPLFHNGKFNCWYYWGFIDGGFTSPQNFQSESQEFTGLLDSKRTKEYPEGQEIYEGDIVEWTDYEYKDEVNGLWHKIKGKLNRDGWADYTFRDVVTLKQFRLWLKNEDFGYEGEGLIDPSICKVVGNIYEHPYLLKGE